MSALDFRVVAGTDFVMNFTAVDSDGNAINLSGYSIDWYLKRDYGEAAIITKSIGSGISVTNAASGLFTVTVLDTDTDDLIGDYYHEAVLTSGGGLIYVLSDASADVGRITFRRLYGSP